MWKHVRDTFSLLSPKRAHRAKEMENFVWVHRMVMCCLWRLWNHSAPNHSLWKINSGKTHKKTLNMQLILHRPTTNTTNKSNDLQALIGVMILSAHWIFTTAALKYSLHHNEAVVNTKPCFYFKWFLFPF